MKMVCVAECARVKHADHQDFRSVHSGGQKCKFAFLTPPTPEKVGDIPMVYWHRSSEPGSALCLQHHCCC